MHRSTRIVRLAAGMLSLVTLLGMIVAGFAYQDYSVSERNFFVLLALISVFLGVDIVRERKVVIAHVIRGAIDSYINLKEDNDDS